MFKITIGGRMVRKIIDLTMPLKTGSPVFPAYPIPIVHTWVNVKEHGFYANLLLLVEHTGTHVDSPAHFIADGKTIDELPLEKFICRGVVVDASMKEEKEEIKREDVENALKNLGVSVGPGWIVLFYTGYDELAGRPEWFNHPGLGEEASKYLVQLGVSAVGIDAPSIDQPPFPAHKTLLPNDIVVYENLTNLKMLLGVRGFKFIGLPLKIVKGSASPVRAIAIVEE